MNFKNLKNAFFRLRGEVVEQLSTSDKSKYSHLQHYIYFAHHPIFSFTEAIIILCESGKSHAAKVLLRTLFEAHIDIIYHQVKDSEQRLAFSAKRMFDERITVLREISELITKYPNLEAKNPGQLFNKEYIRKAIDDQTTHRASILEANPKLAGVKHLKEKAKLCEDGEVENAEPGSFERMYSLIYRQLSPVAHLNIDGLQAFIGQDKYGEIFFHDGNDGHFIVLEAVSISTAFIKDLYDNKILFGDKIAITKEVEDLINEFNIYLENDKISKFRF